MIDHLSIKNFLAFPELEVPELKLINLVAGKNNAGKTALLEAARFVGAYNKAAIVQDISHKRKSRLAYQPLNVADDSDMLELYHGVHLFEINGFSVSSTLTSYEVYLKNKEGKKTPLFDEIDLIVPATDIKPVTFVPSASKYNHLSKFWAKVALTNLEEDILEILSQTMDRDVSRISITDENILIREKGHESPYNIETLGEGAKRILLLALSLVRSKNGLLLIDEIETHLHHSVIRKLWKIIFEYAIKWNIQVVATTHSQDAIREFWYEAAANESYREQMQVLRLQIGRSGKHEVIEYPYEELEFMMDTKLEIRGL
jgi:AAA15 family ATPase/GTPase